MLIPLKANKVSLNRAIIKVDHDTSIGMNNITLDKLTTSRLTEFVRLPPILSSPIQLTYIIVTLAVYSGQFFGLNLKEMVFEKIFNWLQIGKNDQRGKSGDPYFLFHLQMPYKGFLHKK